MNFTNWKTSLFGILMIVMGFLGPVLEYYVPVHGLSWTALFTALATASGGAGLLAARDANNRSTTAQSEAAQAFVDGDPKASKMAEAADLQVKEAPKP